jgi:hypothetical protein
MSSISDSFIPSAIKMWNSLKKMYIRNVDTLSKFKSELKKIDEPGNHVVPKHYIYRPRKLNVENPIGVRVAQSLVFCVMYCGTLFVITFHHCIVRLSSIYDS